MSYVAPSASFEARCQGFPTGLVGTIGVRILDNVGGTTVARATAGITESPAGSGSYVVTLTAPTTAGQYSVFWDTGVVSPSTTAAEDFTVTTSPTIPIAGTSSDYTTSAKLKSSLAIQSASTYADADIALAITAASRGIDNLTHRFFYLHDASNDEQFYYSPSSRQLLEIDDLLVPTTVKLDTDGNGTFETTLTLNTDFLLEPLNAVEMGQPWERIRIHPNGSYALPVHYPRSVEITGRFGWTTVPYEVEQACQILSAQLLKRTRDAAVYGFVSLPGIEINQVARMGRSDPHVMALLDPFIKKTYFG